MGENLQRVKSQAHLMVGPHRQMGTDRSLGLALDEPQDDIIAGQPREVHAAGVAQRRASKMRLAHLNSFFFYQTSVMQTVPCRLLSYRSGCSPLGFIVSISITLRYG